MALQFIANEDHIITRYSAWAPQAGPLTSFIWTKYYTPGKVKVNGKKVLRSSISWTVPGWTCGYSPYTAIYDSYGSFPAPAATKATSEGYCPYRQGDTGSCYCDMWGYYYIWFIWASGNCYFNISSAGQTKVKTN